MKKNQFAIIALVSVLASTLHAQVVADGATNTLSNITNTFSGDVTVGTNGVFTLLVLSDNALLTNSANGVIGFNLTAKSNEVRLVSASARWRVDGSLFVGSNGAANRLVVSNGALLDINGGGTLGNRVDSSNNFALVTGAGSLWSNRLDLRVGTGGRGNQLIVSNGGWVASRSGFVGNNTSGSNNLALVTGSGSVWSNALNLTVGFSGAGNRLVIEAGGLAHCDIGKVGDFGTATDNEALVTGAGSRWNVLTDLTIGRLLGGNRLIVSNGAGVWSGNGLIGNISTAPNNQVLVTGAGSVWSNQNNLTVGDFASGNVLIVSNGATVLSSNLFVGFNSLSADNRVTVDGGTLHVTNAAGTSVLDVRRGTNILNSGLMEVDQLVVTNNSGFFEFNGGTLITRGANITHGVGIGNFYVGTAAGSSPAVWDMRFGPSNTVFSGFNTLRLGRDSPFNQLILTNGALVLVPRIDIGESSEARSNTMVLAGAGSKCVVTAAFVIGLTGACNRVILSDGAVLASSTGFFASSNNEVMVTGAGSLWTNGAQLQLGVWDGGNRLVISNGGWVVNRDGEIGLNPARGDNEVVVTGIGTVWSNRNNLLVGNVGNGNRLVIRDGGKVFAAAATVGFTPATSNNRLVVDGGTLNSGALEVSRGTNVLNSGLITVNSLLLTNTSGHFEFNGGTLLTRSGTIANGQNFVVGATGTTSAIWELRPTAYKPTDYGTNDALPAPAPGRPYSNTLAAFSGTDPNGNWSLYIADDEENDVGSLESWSLQIQTTTGDSVIRANVSPILVPDSVPASHYPSQLTEAGLTGTITDLTVRLSGLTHTGPADLDILLVGPSGQKVMLMSDAGSAFDVLDLPLLFDDVSPVSLPDSSAITASLDSVVFSTLVIGQSVPDCRLHVANGLLKVGGVLVGANSASTGNRVVLNGGTLRATNASATATFEVRRGTNVLNAGLMDLDRLLLTSSEGDFEFNGGTLISRATTDSNGRVFTVGNGVSPATLQLPGGTHVFFNNLDVANNASLVGHGSIIGPLTVKPGGTLAPSNTPSTFGTLSLSQTPVLQGATRMRIYRSEASLVNDQVQTTLTLNYGGSITVTQLPAVLAGTLTLGDRFQLFSAGAYAGGFSTLTLPPLSSGLDWTNKLLVDGSIEVVAATPKFAGISVSGTNVIITGTNGTAGANYAVLTATNVALPLSNWVSLVTNTFGQGGGFSFTNGIAPGELQRYFRFRTP